MQMVSRIARIAACAAVGTVVFAGCGKKEEPAPQKHPVQQSEPVKKETTVSVPASVKGKWLAVKIGVTDKRANKEAVYTVNIGSTFAIPNSNLSLKVETFLPHFIMEGTTLTSQSNSTKNPAAQIRVYENGKEIFKGWLFTLYPSTHAFQHPTYGFSLVDYVPAK